LALALSPVELTEDLFEAKGRRIRQRPASGDLVKQAELDVDGIVLERSAAHHAAPFASGCRTGTSPAETLGPSPCKSQERGACSRLNDRLMRGEKSPTDGMFAVGDESPVEAERAGTRRLEHIEAAAPMSLSRWRSIAHLEVAGA
jgi:hypothetical protein